MLNTQECMPVLICAQCCKEWSAIIITWLVTCLYFIQLKTETKSACSWVLTRNSCQSHSNQQIHGEKTWGGGRKKGKHNLGYQQLSPFCKKQLWELRARSANSNNVVRNILWPETNLTHRVDRCRGMHDTFSKGEVLALPFHLRNSDSQQP